jgi:hypothetical protein
MKLFKKNNLLIIVGLGIVVLILVMYMKGSKKEGLDTLTIKSVRYCKKAGPGCRVELKSTDPMVKAFTSKIQNNEIHIDRFDPSALGITDPYQGDQKKIIIGYSYDGGTTVKTVTADDFGPIGITP